jgi:replicative DNA helicase
VVLRDVLARIEENKKSMEFMKTGFQQLDDLLDGGFLRKELIVIGASTGIGKSYMAGQLTANIAQQGFKCGYFSLEISNEMVVTRMIGAKANIKPTRLQAGLLNQEEFNRKTEAKAYIETLGDYMEFFDQAYELDEIKKLVKEGGYEFVVVDFIQNVMSNGGEEYTRLTKIALELQRASQGV